MEKNADSSAGAAHLRRMAEEKLTATRGESPLPTTEADVLRLVVDLQLHQIELEMQNEELRQATEEAVVLVEKYTDLYDFAPVSYFTLDRLGNIRQANLTGANLIGVNRARLIKTRFVLYV
ncbi:MAG: histidine kinase, partial [Armatimonadota bacterium]